MTEERTKKIERLVKVFNLIGSPEDGEALTAARMFFKEFKALNFDLETVLKWTPKNNTKKTEKEKPNRWAYKEYVYKDLMDALGGYPKKFDFVMSVYNQQNLRGSISEKQKDAIEQMRRTYCKRD
jgi:hypothetical protein